MKSARLSAYDAIYIDVDIQPHASSFVDTV
jgi:hypothetical protein